MINCSLRTLADSIKSSSHSSWSLGQRKRELLRSIWGQRSLTNGHWYPLLHIICKVQGEREVKSYRSVQDELRHGICPCRDYN